MKRYWKVGLLSLIAFLTIGWFYVEKAVARMKAPEYNVETLSGDDKAIEGLDLKAGIVRNDEVLSNVGISKEGSLFDHDLPYFEQREGLFNVDSSLQKLYKEHKSFLRGKTFSPNQYFENDNMYVYVDKNRQEKNKESTQLDISVLEKASGKELEYKVSLPLKDTSFFWITNVQVVGKQLAVSASSSTSNSMTEEWNIFYLDLTKQETDSNDKAALKDLGIDVPAQAAVYFSPVTNFETKQSNDLEVFEVQITQQGEENEEGFVTEEELTQTHYIVYDYAAKAFSVLSLPKELEESGAEHLSVAEKSLYLPMLTGQQLTLYHTASASSDWTSKTIQLPKEVTIDMEKTGYDTTIKEDKLYLISTVEDQDTDIFVMVIDLRTDKVIYTGKVNTTSEKASKQEETALHLYDINVE